MKQATKESLHFRSVAELVEYAKRPISDVEIERRRQAGRAIRKFRETLGTIDINSDELLREDAED